MPKFRYVTVIPMRGYQYSFYDVEADSLEKADTLIQESFFTYADVVENDNIKKVGKPLVQIESLYHETDVWDVAFLQRFENGQEFPRRIQYNNPRNISKHGPIVNLSSDDLHDEWENKQNNVP